MVNADGTDERERRVLLVELDGDHAADTFRRMLGLEGFDIRVARVASTALARALSWQPHVILVLDVQEVDGAAVGLLQTLSQVPALAKTRLVGVVTTSMWNNAFDSLVARGVNLRTPPLWIDDGLFGNDEGMAPVPVG